MDSAVGLGKSPQAQAVKSGAEDSMLYGSNRWDMPAPLLAIVDEHKYVNRLLPLLKSEAVKMRKNSQVDYDCMARVMHYLANFPDQYHHPKEDLIFERMAELAPHTSTAVAKLREDHVRIAGQTQEIIQQIKSPEKIYSSGERIRLADEIDLYIERLREHMSLEEEAILQPAWDSLSSSDWRDIDQAIAAVNDPIFGGNISEHYLPLMQRYINDFVSISSSGPVPIRGIEFLLSRIEQGVFLLTEARQLPRLFARYRFESFLSRVAGLGRLAKARSFSELRSLERERKAAQENRWQDLLATLKQVLDSASGPVDGHDNASRIGTIMLNTEKELLSYQEQPYSASKSPSISWQAALMNLLARMYFKPMMRRLDFDNPNSKEAARLRRKAQVVPPGTRVQTIEEGSFHGAWIIPEEPAVAGGTIFHLPGGGFFAPATDMHRKMLGNLACKVGARALLASYRLLPEHPFPAGLEDALAGYRFLLASGTRPEDIVVTGDSAGGNLALALLLAVRDQGLPMPAACALISPCTDMTFTIGSRESNRWKDSMLPSRNNTGIHARYAGDLPLDYPLISPVFGSFKGFPPMFAFVSSSETLLDDTLVVARKARSEGVDFEVEVWESLPHAWPLYSFLPEAEVAVERLSIFVGNHLRHNV